MRFVALELRVPCREMSTRPVLTADPAYIEAFFDEVGMRFGGVDSYLESRMGLGAMERKRLRDLPVRFDVPVDRVRRSGHGLRCG